MKIAILTLRGEENYGNLLQTYALQKVLKCLGGDVTILNRRINYPTVRLFLLRLLCICKGVFFKYILFRKNILIHSPWVEAYYAKKHEVKNVSKMLYFANHYLNLSPAFRSTKELSTYTKKHPFDIYVVGSDQVWRELYPPKIEDYFLGFLPITNTSKKIAYAASFGTTDSPISEEKMPICVELLKRFNAVSVRESEAVLYMEKVFSRKPEFVLDPTLLLDMSDYEQLIDSEDKKIKDVGILNFMLDATIEKKAIVSACAEEFHLPPTDCMEGFNEEGFQYMSVSRWLSLIKNASLVVTDSFHGCMFSIVFRRNFVIVANKGRGIDRFTSILGLLGLEHRMISSLAEFYDRKDVLRSSIDYVQLEVVLQRMREKSLSFLSSYCV